tara:strand:+ start:188 stop:409 length:222 start_codon:yes stop_codon:yes gene_type:complete
MNTDTKNIIINSTQDNNIDFITLQKMKFIYNALESGWLVESKNNKFIFSKKHEGKKEIYLHSYLDEFIKNNLK